MGLWSGDRRMMEISEAVVGCVVQMLRSGRRYRSSPYQPVVPDPDDSEETLERKWQGWVQQESFQRLVFYMQIHCSKESLTTGNRSSLSYAELVLPLPQSRQLWLAETASQWKETYLRLSPSGPPQKPVLRDFLSNPLRLDSLPALYDSDLAQLIVLHCISSMIRDYQQIQAVSAFADEDIRGMNTLADESEQQRIRHLLQSMRVLNQTDETQFTTHHALLIELLSMHLFTPFEHIEVVAGREGQEEAKAACQVAQNWCQRRQARQAVWNAGQTIRYLREIPLDQFSEFSAVVAYQASLCLWVYGTVALINDPSLADNKSSFQAKCLLNFHGGVEVQQWINLNRGIPMICKPGLDNGSGVGDYILLSSTREAMLYVRDMLQCKALRDRIHPLTAAICDLMSALSTLRPERVVS